MVESSHSSQLRFDDPDDFDGPAPLPAAGVDGSARQENPAATPVGGPDVSIQTGTSTPLLFPSIPKTINQATLVDFMSMWTLLQRRMELPSVPDNSISPTVQTSLTVPERDSDNTRSATPAGSPTRTKSPERFLHTPQSSISSLVRRAKEADRQARTPVRPPRTPVRRSRNHSESGDSRSRSPLSRSSSEESAARDESPLNFNAALDMDSKRAFSEDEDAEGDGKKISAAQYDTFRQAVTSSRGTFKINPAKTKRAARASLLDLGETEVPDRVSRLDQPSLQDTMASTARIAQGLKEDEEVVKTTLSETLNDNTSSSHGGSTLQDGDARVRPLSHPKSGVGGVHRHTRCLSSCADASSCPQVSAFRGQQEGVPVHLSSVWTGNFSTGVHQAAETRRLSVEAARCEATRLLRRLADQSRYTRGSSTAFSDNHQGPPVSRMDHQLREVRPHTKSRLPVHWDAVQHSTLHSGAPAENANKGPVSSSTLDGQSEYNCQRSAQASRHVGVHGLAGSTRTAPSSSSPMVGRYSMVPEDRELVRPDSSSTVGSVRGGMVVIPSSPARSTPRRQGDGSDSLHRCVQFGLGSPVRLTLDTGTVVSISTIVPHKRSRDAGCHLCSERLPTSSEVPCGETDVRQRSDGGVHQERGGHEIAHFDADDHSTAQVVRQQGDYVGSRPSARSTQYPGGFPVQSRPDSDHGVDDGHGESTTSVCQVGRTTDRYVCDIRQQTTRQVRFAISGPQGGVDRCHVHALGQGEGPLVCLPAIQDGSASSAEDRSITRTAGDTDRSTATGSIMVSRADEPNPRRPGSPVRGRSRPAHTRRVHGRGRDRNSSLPAVKSSRVETLRAILRAKGHSREAANMMSRCLRESSQQVYESHWSRFVAFCRTKKWQVFQVRSHHFSTYMMHLFRDDLLPSTIISHRTSVASVLRHWVYDPAADPHIKLLVRAFRLERPVQRRIMPKWDLHLVLLSLMRPPFTSQSGDDGESSDDVIPLKWRTLKCLFLLALASARRRSYLHALSIAPGRCVFARGNTQRQLVVSLLPEPGFLAKNQLPTQAPEWITVPGIAHLNPTEPERMLCPVRQLKLYIRDSESIRGGRQRMFIPWNRSIRDIMRSHISRWIVETVKEAYTQADRQFDRVTAHEVRALSASWAYNCQVALPDILAAAFWRSSGVFQNSYLRDMACVAEGMSTLGPVVVAQHVVDPGHLHPPP